MCLSDFSFRRASSSRGFSLVELMVAMAIGLVLTAIMTSVFLSSRGATRRQGQLTEIQQSVRVAFEYLTFDARAAGHRGCQTGRTSGFVNTLNANALATSYGQGVEGYEYPLTGDAFTMSSNYPTNAAATEWAVNMANPAGINTIPYADIVGSASGAGLTPGSDVLVIRTAVGAPIRLAANTGSPVVSSLTIENNGAGGTCPDGVAKVSGLCANSHALVASCTESRVFSVASIAGTVLTPSTNLSVPPTGPFTAATAEVFPMHTIVYYVARSSTGTTTSLYRRVFDGTVAGGQADELIEGVENLQVRYGVDTTTPTADGIVDAYQPANAVGDWSRVVAVRMGLLVRSTQRADTAVPASGRVDNVVVTYPTAGDRFDRRVFTTTVAIRNRL
jgi:type IV pilus assembly protein PilW